MLRQIPEKMTMKKYSQRENLLNFKVEMKIQITKKI